jgi:hypothetical protein
MLLTAIVAALALPASAAAHSVVIIQGNDILYTSEDAVSNNKLFIDETATAIRFRDREADTGMSGPAGCTVGDTDTNGYSYELTCPKTGILRTTVDLGPNEDQLLATVTTIRVGVTGVSGADNLKILGSTSDLLAGEQGNDVLDGGEGDDSLDGGDGVDLLTGAGGNDTIQAGAGADSVDAGAGDDIVNVPDGSPDKVVCGTGIDTVRADTVDDVAGDCEKVERVFIAPPADEGTADDKTKPVVKSGGSTSQRVSKRKRTVRVAASLSEKGEVSASGFLDAGGLNTPVKTKSYKVDVAGGGVTIVIKLSNRQMKLILRDLGKRRRVTLRVNVVGSDAAGNSTVAKTLKIKLRR